MSQLQDVIIIGGGPGGYAAALYCARAGLDTLLIEKLSIGGQMTQTEQIDNYPGFDQGIDGYELGDRMRRGAERFGAVTQLDEVLALSLADPVKTVQTTGGTLQARTVILATGAVPRLLGLPEEPALTGRGVSYCAACDGMFYRGKTVVVVGGGNTAAADALLLSRICREVILVHRRDSLRAAKVYHQPLLQAPNVSFRWNSAVTALHHDQVLTGVTVHNRQTGADELLACDGLFVAIGRTPATELVRGQLTLDGAGYVVADESTRTNLPGVFAVGDVRTKALRQIVTAVADGATASHWVEEYLAEQA